MSRFSGFAIVIAQAAGSPWAFFLALASVALWAAVGPFFNWSEQHQLLINTGTTIVTFLMVFILQNAQNRDGRVVQIKLDALLKANTEASNKIIGLELESDSKLDEIQEDLWQQGKDQ